MDPPDRITELVAALRRDEPGVWDQLFPLVYDQLRRVAHNQIRRAGPRQTLNSTELVHEAYLRMAGAHHRAYSSRAHFFAVAARAMRQVLIDDGRRWRATKRGGRCRHVALDVEQIIAEERAEALLALDDALLRLSQLDARLGRVVECRFFGGLTEEETAAGLGITGRTVRRDWARARSWLCRELGGGTRTGALHGPRQRSDLSSPALLSEFHLEPPLTPETAARERGARPARPPRRLPADAPA